MVLRVRAYADDQTASAEHPRIGDIGRHRHRRAKLARQRADRIAEADPHAL
jgi:hypothetical protein